MLSCLNSKAERGGGHSPVLRSFWGIHTLLAIQREGHATKSPPPKYAPGYEAKSSNKNLGSGYFASWGNIVFFLSLG